MIPGVGSLSFLRLIRFFGSPDAVLKASLRELSTIRGLTPAICQSIVDHRDCIDADRELDMINRHNCKVITIKDSAYPQNLKVIYDPPPILYIKGNLLPEDSQSISIVGTRTASAYGKQVAEKMGSELALKGFTIVSGMAYGIDTVSHNGALRAGGRTIAVMGNGLDIIYPSQNSGLFERIISSGAAISEFPMGTQPKKENFPIRNRIVSGMSLGTLIIEASKKSGSLITADYALEQGREVFAVPGSIFSDTSKGTHDLIKQGAKLAESVTDIIDELPSYINRPNAFSLLAKDNTDKDTKAKEEEMLIELQLTEEEIAIWKVIGQYPIHIDEISRLSNLPTHKASAALVILELKGLICQSSGKMFTRKKASKG